MADAHCKTGGLALASASAVDRSDSSDSSDSSVSAVDRSDSSDLPRSFFPGTPAFRGRAAASLLSDWSDWSDWSDGAEKIIPERGIVLFSGVENHREIGGIPRYPCCRPVRFVRFVGFVRFRCRSVRFVGFARSFSPAPLPFAEE